MSASATSSDRGDPDSLATRKGEPFPPKAGSNPEEWERLCRLAQRIAEVSGFQADVAARAERLALRLASRQFHIAVLGEFKRGKSTLVNALVGQSLLPSGVVPLTTVATEVHVGATETIVHFADGRQMPVSPENIGDFVTEVGNPSNRLGVSRVEVAVDTAFGAPGLVLVDTPGVASVNEHNTETAHDALLDSDGAVIVLSADSPLSASEEALIAELGQRQAKVFVAINKSDHLSATELDQVRSFVAEHLQRLLGYPVDPYCVAARPALDAMLQVGTSDHPQGEFDLLRNAINSFVREDLAGARYLAALGELQRLGGALAQSIEIEEAASSLDLETLTTQVQAFRRASNEGRRLLDEDGVLLDHDVTWSAATIADALARAAGDTARARQPMLAGSPASLPFRQIEAALADAIQQSVEEGFEPLRRAAQEQAEQAWQEAAERFASRVQARMDELRTTANELFNVHLPVVAVPKVLDQRDRFSYLFLHIESPTAPIGRFVRLLLPTNRARRRAVRMAERRLAEEFDKHAGRARYDITERLDAAKRLFVEEMKDEFAQTEASILDATARVRADFDRTENEQWAEHQVRSHVNTIVGAVDEEVARAHPAEEQ